ncbi:MAG: hypothetical protein OXE74_01805 [Cyanobacteria bacterium MAG CAR2_bin_4]|nr:hypothetical protein [Cyanobacteria bacterium MAG CAR2_bin_4]MCY4331824.1 hypothetical protein [Cyanobacteria bacterium MAG CAR1_bin_15]
MAADLSLHPSPSDRSPGNTPSRSTGFAGALLALPLLAALTTLPDNVLEQ